MSNSYLAFYTDFLLCRRAFIGEVKISICIFEIKIFFRHLQSGRRDNVYCWIRSAIRAMLVQLYRLHFGYVKSAFQGAFTAS